MDKFEKVPKGIFNKIDNNKELFISEFKEKLEKVFPSTIKDGIVDFEALLNEFGKYAETDEKEKYNMTWVGKKDAIRKANEDIVGKTLKYVPKDSKNPDTTQNLYIEGDNLEVLKLLRNSYYAKVKMIYIDPPYNTGKDFIYKDNFTIKKDEYEKSLGNINEYNERLTVLKKGSGRYHSSWLNMMLPRLKVAKDLLTDDGVIFISIDDNEVHNLRKICDEIFGENNFVGELIRKTKSMTADKKTGFNLQHENLLIFAKNIETIKLQGDLKDYKGYTNPDNDPLGEWCSADPTAKSGSLNTFYGIKNPYTSRIDFPSKGRYWAFSKNTLKSYIKKRIIVFKKEYKNTERGFIFKRHKSKLKSLYNPVNSLKFIDNDFMNDKATIELNDLLEISDFLYPKPIIYIKHLINYFIKLNNNSTILDFFSGSATTAHACMQLNAEDGGNRKFIMVQLPEHCDEKSEAFKAGYSSICEIGKERIRRAGEKILEDNKDKEGIENLDVGFKVFKVADTNIKWISDTLNKNSSLEEYRGNMSQKDQLDFNPHFTDIDVVYEMMLKRQDIELTERIDKLEDIGDRTYLVGYTVLVCLEEKITEEMVKKISEIDTSLSWIVFRDSAFDDDINLKTNTMNLLRTLIKEKNPKSKNQKILWI